MMTDPLTQFAAALRARGLIAPEPIIADGRIHRCDAGGKNGKDDGSYLLHLNGIPAGGFENHRDGIGWEKWRGDIGRKFSPEEHEAAHQQQEIARRERDAEIERCREEAAKRAQEIWESCEPAPPDHPYLVAKGVAPHTARVYRGDLAVSGKRVDGALVVSLSELGSPVASLQFILPNGSKLNLAGGKKDGCAFVVQRQKGAPVFLVEGFSTGATVAQALREPANVVVTFGGGNLLAVAQAVRSNLGPDRRIIVCADDDHKKPGNPGLTQAIEAARGVGALLVVPRFAKSRPDGATDFNDLHKAEGLDAVLACLERAKPPDTASEVAPAPDTGTEPVTPNDSAAGEDPEEEGKKETQASKLVAFVLEKAVLFHDSNGDTYALDNATNETRRLDSRLFRDWLVANFYETAGKAPRDAAVREALFTLTGIARFKGEQREVHLRVAHHEGAYYLDLGEPQSSRAVKVAPGSWEIVDAPPVRFIRPDTLRPLPTPVRGGDLSALWKIANIPESSRLLVLAWLCECLRPDTPFPVLELIGEHGSAKSTAQEALRRLVDPNASNLRAAPKEVQDAFIGAGVNWLVSYENVSYLSPQTQDALCVLSTGGGFATRKLYSNSEESVITVKRPIILNGISAAVTAQDLVDRTLSIETPVISRRMESTELWNAFDQDHGALLGALCDLFAKALALLPSITLAPEDRPRLAEFARLGMAVASALGHPAEAFMEQFTAGRAESIARTIDASPVATALIDWFDRGGRQKVVATAKDLFVAIGERKPKDSEAWPKSPKSFADAMRRAAPALRFLGIECRSLGKKNGNIQWSIGPKEKLSIPCPASPDVLFSPAPDPETAGLQDIQDMQDINSKTFLPKALARGTL